MPGKHMTPQDIILDTHTLAEDIEAYERKYGVLSDLLRIVHERGRSPRMCLQDATTPSRAIPVTIQAP